MIVVLVVCISSMGLVAKIRDEQPFQKAVEKLKNVKKSRENVKKRPGKGQEKC